MPQSRDTTHYSIVLDFCQCLEAHRAVSHTVTVSRLIRSAQFFLVCAISSMAVAYSANYYATKCSIQLDHLSRPSEYSWLIGIYASLYLLSDGILFRVLPQLIMQYASCTFEYFLEDLLPHKTSTGLPPTHRICMIIADKLGQGYGPWHRHNTTLINGCKQAFLPPDSYGWMYSLFPYTGGCRQHTWKPHIPEL